MALVVPQRPPEPAPLAAAVGRVAASIAEAARRRYVAGLNPGTALVTSAVAAATLLLSFAAVSSFVQGLDSGFLFAWDGRVKRLRPLRRRLKVAILGNDTGGMAVALWLRDMLGGPHDLDLAIVCPSPSRPDSCSVEVAGQRYEASMDAAAGPSRYLRAIMGRLSLEYRAFRGLHLPVGIFDGSDFLFCGTGNASCCRWHGAARFLTNCRLAFRFGVRPFLELRKLRKNHAAPHWDGIYRALRVGATYAHPREFLGALGHSCLRLCERSTQQWLMRDLGFPRAVVQGLVEPALRSSFGGQNCAEIHALAGLVGLSGGSLGRTASTSGAKGGIAQLPERALEAARPRVLCGTARLVRRVPFARPHEPSFEVAYDASAFSVPSQSSLGRASTAVAAAAAESGVEGLLVEAFHIVVIAQSLQETALRFEGCGKGGTSPEAGAEAPEGWTIPALPALPVRTCVAQLVYGTLNLRRFSSDDTEVAACSTPDAEIRCVRHPHYGGQYEADGRTVQVPALTPLQVWTTATATSSTPFYSISLELPIAASVGIARAAIARGERGEPQVYRVIAPAPLSKAELDKWFARRGKVPAVTLEQFKCPQYSSPQSFRPFVFDRGGIFDVCAIEEVARSPELSLMSARNVVNLIADWVEQHRGQSCF
mmetsp:Transcript_24314/g.54111  ORF Transcript_24314/g.54111 Transcript_24314/m.54111 type:complete len:653 (-) Transcript_24314:19-1977(-)